MYVSREAARYLADREVRTIGVDYLSVGGFREDGVETHQALLGAGIWVIEGLNLSSVGPGGYELICLPLKVEDGDGARPGDLAQVKRNGIRGAGESTIGYADRPLWRTPQCDGGYRDHDGI